MCHIQTFVYISVVSHISWIQAPTDFRDQTSTLDIQGFRHPQTSWKIRHYRYFPLGRYDITNHHGMIEILEHYIDLPTKIGIPFQLVNFLSLALPYFIFSPYFYVSVFLSINCCQVLLIKFQSQLFAPMEFSWQLINNNKVCIKL